MPRIAAEGRADALLGTTADHILRHASVAVLVLHGEPAFHRVPLTTGLSAESRPARARGLALACARGAPSTSGSFPSSPADRR